MFLLDTDHIIILQDQEQPAFGKLGQRMAKHSAAVFFCSVVSFHEQLLGANAYVNRARAALGIVDGYDLFLQLLAFYVAVQVTPFDAAAAAMFGSLRTQKVRISTMDLRIAATALSRQLTVLTRNLRDFDKVPGLLVADWTT